ncbi:TonB-dependent siderophore receptor [Acinetobacter zhairhuonensis]|uniref:TonB-dependent siderophore receptor n=1 Tax=Acinetobacter sp. A7.4 TaxID=2919921 RepID=UPI001F4D51F0|nr:TonB-dependent receptor [Acinetobacter sp. A7.4]MCJ8160352.1 TonB-dependent receptor [Acinetobacter sp. A7.4]
MKDNQVKNTLAIAIRAVLLGIPLMASSFASTAVYAVTTYPVNITQLPLDEALKQLAIQTGTTISYDANTLSNLQSKALKGHYAVDQALTTLLQPHALVAVQVTNDGYSIQANPQAQKETHIIKLVTIQTQARPTNGLSHAQMSDDANTAHLPTIALKAQSNTLATENSGTYKAEVSTAATGLTLALKQTPQLVSVITRQQMDDQHLTQLTDVVTQAAGLSINQSGNIGSDNSPIYARGQAVDSYLLDGVKLLSSYSSIFQSQDTALFDRVEIVRGANGLMTGAGTASASINMVRKKPLQDFKASVSSSLGSWDTYRADVDVSSPLNEAGTVRGRAVLAYQTGDSYIDRYSEDRKIAYGVIEANLSPNTKASVGASYQQMDISGIARGGLPSFYSDGSLIDWSRSDSAAASWTYSDRTTKAYFADLEHHLNEHWTIKGTISRTETASDEVVGYTYSRSGIDKVTGAGAMLYATRWDYKPTQDLFNLTLNGSFDLFDQTHDVFLGTTYTKSENKRPTYSGWNNAYTWDGDLDNIFTWDGTTPSRPETMIDGWYSNDETSQSVFGAIRLKLADPLAIILGTRVENWERIDDDYSSSDQTTTYEKRQENGEVIPYFGITYDFTEHWTGYASYTNIFSPQDKKTNSGGYIEPLIGNSTELGIKADFFDHQLNFGAAIYQTQEDNKAIAITNVYAPDGSQAYRTESGTESRGFELETTGKLNDKWLISASFTRNLSEDNQGNNLNSTIPNNTAKLFSTYTLPYLNEALTIGGGLRWQSDIYSDNAGPAKVKFTQDSYAVVDLMARYKVNENLLLNFKLNNLFNEKYHLSTTNSYYGAPTNLNVGVRYQW